MSAMTWGKICKGGPHALGFYYRTDPACVCEIIVLIMDVMSVVVHDMLISTGTPLRCTGHESTE